MQTVIVKSKAGTDLHLAVMDSEFERAVMDGTTGLCIAIACGAEASGVEPDARRYECEGCGRPRVYGLEELLMMGLVRGRVPRG